MKQILTGLLAGGIFGLLPLFSYDAPQIVRPEWSMPVNETSSANISPFITKGGEPFTFKTDQRIFIVGRNGSVDFKDIPLDSIVTLSGNGQYYASYQKVGENIDLFDLNATRYWRIESSQYPYLSQNAKLILLLVADLSDIKMMDINANPINTEISGRFCTSISFSAQKDGAIIGFLDGTYYIVNEKGTVIFKGKTDGNLPVKSAAVSPELAFAAIHYGNTLTDKVAIINVRKNKIYRHRLLGSQVTKTALLVSDEGETAVIDLNQFEVLSPKGKVLLTQKIAGHLPGHSSIVKVGENYFYSYRSENGAEISGITDSSQKLFSRSIPEIAVDLKTRGNIILARGTNNLYAWSLDQ